MSKVLTRRKPTQQRSQETKDKILSAASEILKNEGAKGLTTRNLAKEAGISVGSIYEYFPNVQAVIYWLYKQRIEAGMELVDEIFNSSKENLTLREVFIEYNEKAKERKLFTKTYHELLRLAERDPKMLRLTKKSEDDLTEKYVHAFKVRGATMSDEELTMFAQYMHEIDRINLTLQFRKSKKEREFYGFLTTKTFELLSLLTGCSLD